MGAIFGDNHERHLIEDVTLRERGDGFDARDENVKYQAVGTLAKQYLGKKQSYREDPMPTISIFGYNRPNSYTRVPPIRLLDRFKPSEMQLPMFSGMTPKIKKYWLVILATMASGLLALKEAFLYNRWLPLPQKYTASKGFRLNGKKLVQEMRWLVIGVIIGGLIMITAILSSDRSNGNPSLIPSSPTRSRGQTTINSAGDKGSASNKSTSSTTGKTGQLNLSPATHGDSETNETSNGGTSTASSGQSTGSGQQTSGNSASSGSGSSSSSGSGTTIPLTTTVTVPPEQITVGSKPVVSTQGTSLTVN